MPPKEHDRLRWLRYTASNTKIMQSERTTIAMENISQETLNPPEENTVPAAPDSGRTIYTRRTILLTMLALFLVLLLASMDQDIVGTAMPRIIGELHGFDRYTWVTTAYMLAATVMIPIYGKLSDLFGRKRILLICVLFFLGSSALCGASQSMTQLILFRGLQGLGAGGIPPVIMATTADLLAPRERGKWMGLFGSVMGLSAILGPVIGGWITDHASWRWVFYVNLPLGIVALLAMIVLMPSLRQHDKRVRIDYLGVLLLIMGAVPIMLGFSWAGSQYAWLSWQIILLLGVGLSSMTIFFIHESRLARRNAEPIIDPALFKNRAFSISLAAVSLTFMGLLGSAAFLPLYIQGVQGISATASGLMLMPMFVAATLGSIGSGQLLSRLGKYKWLAITGAALTVVGNALLLLLGVHSNYLIIIIAMLLFGLGVGSGMSIYGTIVQSAVTGNFGQAMSTFDFFQELGGPLALGAMGSLLSARYVQAFAASIPAQIKQALPASTLALFGRPDTLLNPGMQQAMTARFAASGPHGLALLEQIMDTVRAALTQSIHTVFLVSAVLLLLGLVVVLFLPQIELTDTKEEAA
jgi:EmrB/QacA subfamily drug resistance transporter